MKIDGFKEARCLFIDGPVAIYVSEASADEIVEAMERLGKVVGVAAKLMVPHVENPPISHVNLPTPAAPPNPNGPLR